MIICTIRQKSGQWPYTVASQRFLAGMAISGLGFGVYVAVGLALVVDVLPDYGSAAKDLGVFNIAGAD